MYLKVTCVLPVGLLHVKYGDFKKKKKKSNFESVTVTVTTGTVTCTATRITGPGTKNFKLRFL